MTCSFAPEVVVVIPDFVAVLRAVVGPDQWIALPPSHRTRWDTHPWDDLSMETLPLLHGGDIRRVLTQAVSLFGAASEGALR
ncbi:hypothetical protein ACH4TQ_30765 [Streptomyces sp. NPDC021218]|uniref:hypothetical protein n=1 Tax=Streptomyces sp. NPDC021218 TaxID=3365119 RepID=UPI0037BDB8DC